MTASAPAAGKSSANATRLRKERSAERKAAAEILLETPALSERLVHPPIDSVQPSPNNPRKRFDQDGLDELADSIRENGVLQPILIRQSGPQSYEIVAGERRWRAARLAGMQFIPAVLLEAGGEQAARVARIVENVQREDLLPLELADAIADLLELGLTQTEAAKRIGLRGGQSRAAHLLKLRELPSEVKQILAGSDLSTAHAEALTRWSAFPAFAAMLARNAATDGWPARMVANPDFQALDELLDDQAQVAEEAPPVLFVRLGRGVLDRAKCATDCPFGAFVGRDLEQLNQWSRLDWCLRPEHAGEVEAQLLAERQQPRPDHTPKSAGEALQAAVDAARAPTTPTVTGALEVGDRVRHSKFGEGSVLEAKPNAVLIKPDDGGKDFWTGLNAFGGGKIEKLEADGYASPHTPEVVPPPKLPALNDLPYDSYAQIYQHAPSPCRAGECACFGKARGYRDEVVDICTDKKRQQSLVAQISRGRNVENKRRHVEAVSRLEDKVRGAVGVGVREVAVVASAIANAERGYYHADGARFPQALSEAAERLASKASAELVRSDLGGNRKALDKLAGQETLASLLVALVEAVCRQDLAMRYSPDGGPSYGALAEWYVGDLPKRAGDDWQPPEKGSRS